MLKQAALLTCFTLGPVAAAAEVELSFYGGVQSAPPSDISIRDPEIGDDDFSQSWEGRSFEAPPYYGLRATSWQTAFTMGKSVTSSICGLTGWLDRL